VKFVWFCNNYLRIKLCDAINQISEGQEIACAFPELRCTFGDRSLVPDISVLVFRPKQEPVIFARSDRLPVLGGIDLEMSPNQIFNWLKMKRIATD